MPSINISSDFYTLIFKRCRKFSQNCSISTSIKQSRQLCVIKHSLLVSGGIDLDYHLSFWILHRRNGCQLEKKKKNNFFLRQYKQFLQNIGKQRGMNLQLVTQQKPQ
ncbi:Hypothetical_protein [Hexamita inflata]|uniref:Hypothetical_protein n=1 Tax=Hexamita inflata TaxID=28002 RepID=A0AA86QSI6_9EUKA|nr:Hypothetical protein HINF_LOCUS189 [Hexamita inflata]CAI9962257.1 Hypothetical protein HINF_LOCUS49902 [Hexamita inflata]